LTDSGRKSSNWKVKGASWFAGFAAGLASGTVEQANQDVEKEKKN
jgi:hypothetical protein